MVGDINEIEHHSVNFVLGSAIRNQPRQIPAAVAGMHLALSGLQILEDRVRVFSQGMVVKPMGEMFERTSDIRCGDVEQLLCPFRIELDPQPAVEKYRADVGRAHQVLKVAVDAAQFLNLLAQFLVDRGQLLVERLQLFFAGFEFFGG